MPGPSDAQKQTIARVMQEFKQGELESNGGQTVRNPKQAIAIALSEAGASSQQTPAQNKRRLATTKKREHALERTKADLYAEAARKNIAGRSRMTKAELARAVTTI